MEARKLSQEARRPFQISLRICHPSIDPADISRELGMEAEHSFRAGDSRQSGRGVYTESYWIGVLRQTGQSFDLSLPNDRRSMLAQQRLTATTETLDWALGVSVSSLLQPRAQFLRRLRAEGGQCSLLVNVLEGEVASFSLHPEVSRLLGELGIVVEFELGKD
jgi:hypothetical protein